MEIPLLTILKFGICGIPTLTPKSVIEEYTFYSDSGVEITMIKQRINVPSRKLKQRVQWSTEVTEEVEREHGIYEVSK